MRIAETSMLVRRFRVERRMGESSSSPMFDTRCQFHGGSPCSILLARTVALTEGPTFRIDNGRDTS
jgi:hypothetical protein